MATIRLTGFNTTTGKITSAGTSDTLTTDGSMTIGDADDDTIVVNAEFDSDLIPDDDSTYDLGSAAKKWQKGYFSEVSASGEITGQIRHVNTAKFSSTDASQRYVRWDSAGSNGSPGVNNKFLAPARGRLLTVTIRSTSTAGNTDIAFHKSGNGTPNLNTTATESITVSMSSANTAYEVSFINATFSPGEILGISIYPESTPNDVNVTAVWLFDWN